MPWPLWDSEWCPTAPFGNGNGYGDGRAISVGELMAHGQRYELQLKGAGRTPFCRGTGRTGRTPPLFPDDTHVDQMILYGLVMTIYGEFL